MSGAGRQLDEHLAAEHLDDDALAGDRRRVPARRLAGVADAVGIGVGLGGVGRGGQLSGASGRPSPSPSAGAVTGSVGTTGGLRSTVHENAAGVASGVPKRSRIPTVNVCAPAASPEYANGGRQGTDVAPSSEQSKRESGWLPRKTKLASVERAIAAGPEMISVSGCATGLNVMSSTVNSSQSVQLAAMRDGPDVGAPQRDRLAERPGAEHVRLVDDGVTRQRLHDRPAAFAAVDGDEQRDGGLRRAEREIQRAAVERRVPGHHDLPRCTRSTSARAPRAPR